MIKVYVVEGERLRLVARYRYDDDRYKATMMAIRIILKHKQEAIVKMNRRVIVMTGLDKNNISTISHIVGGRRVIEPCHRAIIGLHQGAQVEARRADEEEFVGVEATPTPTPILRHKNEGYMEWWFRIGLPTWNKTNYSVPELITLSKGGKGYARNL